MELFVTNEIEARVELIANLLYQGDSLLMFLVLLMHASGFYEDHNCVIICFGRLVVIWRK